MARSLRIEYPGAWYHVTSRGNERRAIFGDDVDRDRFLEILEDCSGIYHVDVHVYVLMENHFHLVVMTHEANLHRFMHRFNTSYTVYFNRRHGRSGHLYQGRYKALLVDAESYLLELSRYVHLNPVRIHKFSSLGVKEKVKILDNYPWSSFKGYTLPEERVPFVSYSKILRIIGGIDGPQSRRRYADFVLSGIGQEMDADFWEELKGQTILGSDGFVDRVREHFITGAESDGRELPALKELGARKATISMEEIARRVASLFEVDEAELYRPYAACREARSVFMESCCLLLSNSMSLSEIGRQVGNVSAAALIQNRKRLEEKMNHDTRLLGLFENLKEDLARDLSTVKV